MATTTSNSESMPGTVPTLQPSGAVTPADSQASSGRGERAQRRNGPRPLYDNLGNGPARERVEAQAGGADRRMPFVMTPGERETQKLNLRGRALSELEILQEKHDNEFRQVVPIVAEALQYALDANGAEQNSRAQDERYGIYETNSVPGIQVEDYVHRIAEYTYISPSSLIAALIFLDRLSARHSTLVFTTLNIFKLFFVAVRVASKVVELRTLNNRNFASVGGISNRHLNDLEARFLIDMRFDLFLVPREFALYAARVTRQHIPCGIHKPLAGAPPHRPEDVNLRREASSEPK